jgi:hypothetical protein
MTHKEAADIVAERTGHERYRWLVSDDNPDEWQREAYRSQVIGMALNKEPEPWQIPLDQQVMKPQRCCGG